jgi:23S rRNA pseudouridine2605 synthase
LPGSQKPEGQKPAGDRIAKVIARAGICSRRDAEKLILEGRVKLDGVVVTSPALNVTENNVVQVDEKPLAQPEAARLWRYHKPSGLVTTHKDEKGRPTVFANLPKHLGRVVSVGRLDFNSEGLLLLTNDGEIARRLEIPAAGWTRIYRARLFGKVTQADLDKLATGITIDGVKYGPIVADLERSKGMYSWATVSWNG